MKPKTRRLLWILAGLTCLITAVFILMNTLRDSLVFYYSPSELLLKQSLPETSIRLGGLVKKGTLTHPSPTEIRFVVTDYQHDIEVSYQGLLPDLFREGQGVVATGKVIDSSHFQATELLAKHDEKYVPKEVAKSLKMPHK